ncbi:MAG: diaminopropionate ammonia-lyase [Hyphomonadaceae bacterium]|nr:diaminopropionate ammonia-lyase [Hyphomonadaceae bacterium]
MTASRIFRNSAAFSRGSYQFQRIQSLRAAGEALEAVRACPRYQPTPLLSLPGAARRVGVASVHYKDESRRFGAKSFKTLGGGYAVCRLLQRELSAKLGRDVKLSELFEGAHRRHAAMLTMMCASDGNHGLAVAEASRMLGCKCIVFLHSGVSPSRVAAIESRGANVVRTDGDYDKSVVEAAAAATAPTSRLVADTSNDPDDPVSMQVMQGYAVIAIETLDQLEAAGEKAPTHVFLQGGVGGLAGALTAYFWERLGDEAPVSVIVEPERADCLFQSIHAGEPRRASGDLETIMAGLSCGEVSRTAWPILVAGAHYYMVIADAQAADAMRLLASGELGGSIVAGESGAAGLAGLLALARTGAGLNSASRVLLIGTEGATDPDIYTRIVGRRPEQVGAGA